MNRETTFRKCCVESIANAANANTWNNSGEQYNLAELFCRLPIGTAKPRSLRLPRLKFLISWNYVIPTTVNLLKAKISHAHSKARNTEFCRHHNGDLILRNVTSFILQERIVNPIFLYIFPLPGMLSKYNTLRVFWIITFSGSYMTFVYKALK